MRCLVSTTLIFLAGCTAAPVKNLPSATLQTWADCKSGASGTLFVETYLWNRSPEILRIRTDELLINGQNDWSVQSVSSMLKTTNGEQQFARNPVLPNREPKETYLEMKPGESIDIEFENRFGEVGAHGTKIEFQILLTIEDVRKQKLGDTFKCSTVF